MNAKTEELRPMPDILIPEFEEWMANAKDDTDIASLIAVFDLGAMGPQINAGMFRLTEDQRKMVRYRAITVIVQERGRWDIEVSGVLWRTDGERLWAELPFRSKSTDREHADQSPEPFTLGGRKVVRKGRRTGRTG